MAHGQQDISKTADRLTLREARARQEMRPGSRVIVDPNLWASSQKNDDRFNPDHPRHSELMVSHQAIYLVVEE